MTSIKNNRSGREDANESFPAARTSGYSNTELTKKLGLQASQRTYFINAPDEYFEIIKWSRPRTSMADISKLYDFIHVFFTSKFDLQSNAPKIVKQLDVKGILWVSWPKKSQKFIESDITEQDLRDILLPLGVVDVKVCAVTDVWSGLKFVWRRK